MGGFVGKTVSSLMSAFARLEALATYVTTEPPFFSTQSGAELSECSASALHVSAYQV